MSEEAKAVQEVAKVTGKSIDAATRAGSFLSRFLEGPLEQASGLLEDRLRFYRWERYVRYMRRSEELLQQAGLSGPTRPVPLKLALPLIEHASMEDDDELQDRWAALLVNAANASFQGEVRRAHLSMLEQLTAFDVRNLDLIYSLPFVATRHDGVLTAFLPNEVRLGSSKAEDDNAAEPSAEVVLSLSNLARLGCVRPQMSWGGGEYFSKVNPTLAGQAFVDACRVKKASSA